MKLAYTIWIFLLISACSSRQEGDSAYFLRPDISEQQGIVNKYYVHQRSNNQSEIKTDIEYRQLQQLGENLFQEVTFNAGLQKNGHLILEKTDTGIKVVSEYMIVQDNYVVFKGDTIQCRIADSLWMQLPNPSIDFSKSWSFRGRVITREQKSSYLTDTIINGIQCKILEGNANTTISFEKDTTEIESQSSEVYAKNIGLLYKKTWNENSSYEYELVEQISNTEFNKMLDKARYRVGHIDTLNVLEGSPSVKTCEYFDKILDYYNDKDSGYLGGKGKLINDLMLYLDPNSLNNETGYLTFRFVINCHGEAGFFTTEESDLEFRKKDFSEETRQHLLEFLKSVKSWKALNLRGEYKDSYFYICFKLKKGEIIDILP